MAPSSFTDYDVDRACALLRSYRDTLRGEDRRLVGLVIDLAQAVADGAYEYLAAEEVDEGAPPCGDTPAQNGAAA